MYCMCDSQSEYYFITMSKEKKSKIKPLPILMFHKHPIVPRIKLKLVNIPYNAILELFSGQFLLPCLWSDFVICLAPFT